MTAVFKDSDGDFLPVPRARSMAAIKRASMTATRPRNTPPCAPISTHWQ
jgi:hypothetical protein